MSMTKGEFAKRVRAIQAHGEFIDDSVLEELCADLHYVKVLAEGFSEEALKKLEAADKERFW